MLSSLTLDGYTIARFIYALTRFYEFLVVAYVLLSWVPRENSTTVNSIYDMLGRFVEPYLRVFRGIVPPIAGLDFTPVLALFALDFVRDFVIRLILS